MKKICLTVVGMYILFFHGFAQNPEKDSTYKPQKLKVDEINLVSSYYNQTADKSAVMGGRTDSKGIDDVTDLANGLDIKFVGWNSKQRKNSLTAGLGIDYHTATSQAFVDSNGRPRNNGTRIYPTLDWTIENERKGTEFGLGLYYLAEHNYYHSFGLTTSYAKKNHNTGEFSVKLTGYFDNIKMIRPSEFIPVDSVKNIPISDSVVYKSTGNISVMTFDSGEGLTEKTSPFDTFALIIEGKAEINGKITKPS